MSNLVNKKLYLIFGVVSVALMIPYCVVESRISGLCSNIGCSVLAATAMAVFLDLNTSRYNNERLQKAKNKYFRPIYEELIMLMERFICLDSLTNEKDIVWGLEPSKYYTPSFAILASQRCKVSGITYSKAQKYIKDIGVKYNLENINDLSGQQKERVKCMFRILHYGCVFLLREAAKVEKDKLLLEAENYTDVEMIEQLTFNISLCVSIMDKGDKNYAVVSDSLLNALSIVKRIGAFDKDDIITPGFRYSFSINEL